MLLICCFADQIEPFQASPLGILASDCDNGISTIGEEEEVKWTMTHFKALWDSVKRPCCEGHVLYIPLRGRMGRTMKWNDVWIFRK